MPHIIVQQLDFLLRSFTVWTNISWEHLSYHLILVYVGYNQLVKSEIYRSKEKNWKSSVVTHKYNKSCSMQWIQWWQKTLFVRTWFSNFDRQNLTIALVLVSSFTRSLIFFMENVNPIYLFIFLFSHSQCAGVKDCVKEKKRNTSHNQCLLSVTNVLSSNLNNKFHSSLAQNVSF